MPDGSPLGGPYRTSPSPDDERITEPICRGVPEDIPGLAWSKPDFSATEHKLVRTFSVDRKQRRAGSFIPCAICSNGHPKFLDGAVLWSPDGWLRVIGHVCAARPQHFGEARYRGLQKRRQQEELDKVAFEWLHAHIEAFYPLAARIEALKSVALFLEGQRQILFRDVPGLAALLANAAQRQGGRLTVVEELSGTRRLLANDATGMAQSQYETIQIGVLRGGVLLSKPHQKRSRQIEGIIEALNRIPAGSGEESLLALMEGGEQEMTVTAGMVLRAVQRAGEIAKDCAEAAKFVAPDNLTALEIWGRDTRNTVKFTTSRIGSKLTLVLADRSRATLSTSWPALPDLSMMEAIIAAGMRLDGLLP